MVISAIDLIDNILTDHFINTNEYLPLICFAYTMGKCMLNKYYNKTNELEIYRIAMSKCLFQCMGLYNAFDKFLVLYSEFKLVYFKKAKWNESWIKTVKQIIHNKWKWK